MKNLILHLALWFGMIGSALAQNPGDLDLSFNGTGYRILADSVDSQYKDLCPASNDRIVAGGLLEYTSGYAIVVDRFLSNGALDSSFGSGGRFVLHDFDASSTEWLPVHVQADDKIVMAGNVSQFGIEYLIVLRLDQQGAMDSSFGQGGYVLEPLSTLLNHPLDLMVSPTGEMVLLGFGENGLSMLHLLPDGNRDNGYGTNGLKWTTWQGFSDLSPISGQISADGSAHVLINESAWNPRFIVVALDANSQLRSGFGQNGRQIVPQSHISGWDQSMYVNGQKQVLVSGTPTNNGSFFLELGVIRLDSTGSLDGSFGNSGLARFRLNGGDLYPGPLLEQVDGKLLVAMNYEGPTSNLVIGRLTALGEPDSIFGQGGMTTPLIGGLSTFTRAMVQQADGKILTAGFNSAQFQENDAMVARLDGGLVIAAVDGPIAQENLTVVPNPSVGEVKLLLNDWSEPAEVSVMDLAGRQLLQTQWTTGQAASLQLDLGRLSGGTYVVRVVGDGRVATGRLVLLQH